MKGACITDIGYLRDENQDHAELVTFSTGVLAVVCDGMGGERAGKEASEMAVKVFIEHFQEQYTESMDMYAIRKLLLSAASAANTVVYTSGKLNYQNYGMGTTCVAVFGCPDGAAVINVGDSRAYCYADGVLEPITIDHTFVNYLLDQGKITEEEAVDHPMKHMIVRAVGAKKIVQADEFFVPYKEGMKLLLCSDGLHGFCTKEEIQEIMQQEQSAQKLTKQLLQLALKKGGKDNIAIAVITD